MLRFVATECGSKAELDTLICGASNSNGGDAAWHSFIFMRAMPGVDEDDGPYFELDDQSQGFHNVVKSVRFVGNIVTIALAPPRGEAFGHRTIVTELRCSRAQVAQFKKGLRVVFRDAPHRVIGA